MTTPDAGQAKPSSQNTRLIEEDLREAASDDLFRLAVTPFVLELVEKAADEIERLRGVEARYEWLKSSSPEGCWWSEYAPNPHDFDACIDAAIAASRSTGADHG